MFKINSAYINLGNTQKMHLAASNVYRVYKNPNAKDLFMKAQKAETPEEKQKLFDMMGEYETICEIPKKISRNRIGQFLKGLLNVFKFYK